MVWCTDSWNKREFRNKPTLTQFLVKVPKLLNGERKIFSIICAVTTAYLYGKKMNLDPYSTPHKKEFKTDHRTEYVEPEGSTRARRAVFL